MGARVDWRLHVKRGTLARTAKAKIPQALAHERTNLLRRKRTDIVENRQRRGYEIL